MIDKNLVLVAARHTPTALKEPCVWQHQTAESVSDLPQDERAFAGDLCVFAASDGTKTAFRYEHYWECDGEKKFDVYAPEVISENGTVVFTKDGEEVEELTYGDTVTVTVTADQGYQVKTITLNGEEIENGAEITVDGDITLVAEFEEAPTPSGTELVPLAEYTTLPGEGTRGAYEYELPEDVVEAYYTAVQSASDTSDIKHNVIYNGTAYTNKTIINDYYIGNGYLVGAAEVDTGEDWCFLVGSGFALLTRAPATVTFGVNYNVEAPAPSAE